MKFMARIVGSMILSPEAQAMKSHTGYRGDIILLHELMGHVEENLTEQLRQALNKDLTEKRLDTAARKAEVESLKADIALVGAENEKMAKIWEARMSASGKRDQ